MLAKEPRDRFQDRALPGAAPVPAPPPTTQAIVLPRPPLTTMPAESSRGTGILKVGIAILLMAILAVTGFLGFTVPQDPDTTVTPTTPSSVRVTTRVLPSTSAYAPPTAPPRAPEYGTR